LSITVKGRLKAMMSLNIFIADLTTLLSIFSKDDHIRLYNNKNKIVTKSGNKGIAF
jgi:hypothetical protein